MIVLQWVVAGLVAVLIPVLARSGPRWVADLRTWWGDRNGLDGECCEGCGQPAETSDDDGGYWCLDCELALLVAGEFDVGA